jgi:hypothetical protein
MRPRRLALTSTALAVALLGAPTVQSATKTWSCTSDYWDSAGCWSPSGLPQPGDFVRIGVVGGVNTTVWFDEVTGAQVINELVIDRPTGPSAELWMAGGSLSTQFTTVGSTGIGGFVQQGGTHAASSYLMLGRDDYAYASTYALQGGLLETGATYVGFNGYGDFRQSGGVHRSAGLVLNGRYSQYAMTGGTLQVSGGTQIQGGATFKHSAGSFTTSTMFVGRNAGDGGYDMGSGSGQLMADTVQVGWDGWFAQGGNASVTLAGLVVGGESGRGLYRLEGGELQAGYTVIGDEYQGTFLQGAGTHRVDALVLGNYAGGQGGYSLSGGTLESAEVEVGRAGTGTFDHTGGSHSVSVSLVIGSTGHYRLGGWGSLQVAGVQGAVNYGSFEQTGGLFAGTLHNHGSFVYGAAGHAYIEFSGQLVNHGNVTLNGNATFADGLRNEASLDLLPTGRTLTLNGQGLTNNGSFVLAGGTLQGNAAIVNAGDMTGHGRIGGWEIDNFGSFAQRHGTLALSPSSGAVFNYGRWDLEAGRELRLDGSEVVFDNLGSMALAGGRVTGSGQLLNRGVISGNGTVLSRFHNSGTLAIGAEEQLTVGGSFASDGQIDLRGGGAALSAPSLQNQGLLAGHGRVMADIANQAAGRIVAEGGVLTLGAKVDNAGLLAAEAGGTLLLQRAMLAQTGTLQLNGGTIDLNGATLRNDGIVTGHGTLRGTVIDNAGRMLFSDGSVQVQGTVDHLAGAQIVVSGGGTATFQGTVQARAGSEIRVSTDSVAVFFAAVSQASGAAFTGDGTRYFEGGLSVGDSPGAGGAEGSVVFGSTNLYRAEIGGLAAGSGFDHFAVGDHLSLGGTLQLSWWGGFEAQAGQRFDLFDWGSVSGSFAAIDLSAAALDPGLRWDTSRLYLDGSVAVAAVPEPGIWALMALGLAVIGGGARARTRSAASILGTHP